MTDIEVDLSSSTSVATKTDTTIEVSRPMLDVEVDGGASTGPPGPIGPQGPPGPPGPPGTDGAYRHVQSTPSTAWVVNHGLGFRPNVTVVDSLSREVFPDTVQYPTDATVQINFSAALGGEAYLS